MSFHNYLFLDPSSTAVGWALFQADCDDLSTREVVLAAKIEPKRSWPVRERIAVMQVELDEILRRYNPGWVALEIPSGKVHMRHEGGGSGLSVYGYAVGRIEEFCRAWCHLRCSFVEAVPETASTGGFPKEKRRKVALKAWPKLAGLKDPEFDISDAIAFGMWWFDVWPKIQEKREKLELERTLKKKARRSCRKKRPGTSGSRRRGTRAETSRSTTVPARGRSCS